MVGRKTKHPLCIDNECFNKSNLLKWWAQLGLNQRPPDYERVLFCFHVFS